MKRSRLGGGETDCILCGEVFRFYHRAQRRCTDCNKMTCGKCGVETYAGPRPKGPGGVGDSNSGFGSLSSLTGGTLSSSASFMSATGLSGLTGGGPGGKETVWLCKICAEEKEMWKKSGAWFFKVSLPIIIVRHI